MQTAPLVFVIEDEEDIADLIKFNLQAEGFKVQVFNSGEIGLQACKDNPPDLVLLDLMLPGMSGFEVCKNIRSTSEIDSLPIIMLTAKGEEHDVVKGLELGANDYITKPFSPKILAARIRSALRNVKNQMAKDESAPLKVHGIEVHLGKHEVLVDGEKIDLTHSEFQILSFLAKKPGWVFTRSQIVDAIRGEDYAVTDRTIDFQMVGLRKKLGDKGSLLETVRGVGYRLKE